MTFFFYIADDGAFLPDNLTPPPGQTFVQNFSEQDHILRGGFLYTEPKVYFRQVFVCPGPYIYEFAKCCAIAAREKLGRETFRECFAMKMFHD